MKSLLATLLFFFAFSFSAHADRFNQPWVDSNRHIHTPVHCAIMLNGQMNYDFFGFKSTSLWVNCNIAFAIYSDGTQIYFSPDPLYGRFTVRGESHRIEIRPWSV